MTLRQILKGFSFKLVNKDSNLDLDISDIVYDSRKVVPGCVFVCLVGSKFDGHDYINQAIKLGAVAIVVSHRVPVYEGVDFIITDDTRYALACMSAEYFSHPSESLITIAITGTKGKTTTSAMIKSILDKAGISCGIIGTLGVFFKNKSFKTNNTTPESYEIQYYLREMVNNGCKAVVIETSSLGLKTHRSSKILFDYGVFTNFATDHVSEEEHPSIEDYKNSKSLLFRTCKTALVNIDDPSYKDILKSHTCKVISYSFKSNSADYKASNIKAYKKDHIIATAFTLQKPFNMDIELSMLGDFNAYNALAAIAVCNELKIPTKFIFSGLLNTRVKGRTEVIPVPGNFVLVIDYAHNALSLENILCALRKFYSPKRLICMFGSTGNRDKYRRYGMGKVAGRLADLSVVTEDDSHEEDVNDIIGDIQRAIREASGKSIAIPNRREAIEYCLKIAKDGDVILFAGKGHEDFKEIKGVKYHFDEREIIKEILNI